jgi:beta-fructofuranosidase
MHSLSLALAIGCASVVNAVVDNFSPFYPFGERQSSNTTCDTDRDTPPGDLTQCGNSTLFFVWRPKARFIAPEGWMNDPQGKNLLPLALG